MVSDKFISFYDDVCCGRWGRENFGQRKRDGDEQLIDVSIDFLKYMYTQNASVLAVAYYD